MYFSLPILMALFILAIYSLFLTLAGIVSGTQPLFCGEQSALMVRGFMGNARRMRRTVELQTIISRLTLIMRLNLPLSSAIGAAARGEHRRVRQTLEQMGRSIQSGSSVSVSLADAFDGCPPQLIGVLCRAESCGQLSVALSDVERNLDRLIELQVRSTPHARQAVSYLAFMLLFVTAVVSWFMVILMPRFKDIFSDFQVGLPKSTLTLVTTADWLIAHGWIFLVPVILGTGFVTIEMLHSRRSANGGIFARLVAAMRWAFPPTRTMDFGLGMAQAIRSMMLTIRSGVPAAFTSTLPSVVCPTNRLRARLADFSRQVERGVSPHQAADNAKLGTVLVCALRMVERGEDADRVLGHAAEYHETVAYRWWHALSALSGPLVTLSLGLLVSMVAFALFMPLITLIDAVAGTLG